MKLRYGSIDPHTVEAVYEGVHTPDYIARYTAHIAQHGVRNPILVWARNGRQVVHSGNTRVFACRQLGIQCPALIADWDDKYPDFQEIKGEKAVRRLFPGGLIYLGISDDVVTLAPFPIPL